MSRFEQFQINLPNGYPLAWKAPQDKGSQNQWFRHTFDESADFSHPNKLRRPLLGGLSALSSGQMMALFDWDRSHIPAGMTEQEYWEGARRMASVLGGVLFRSASNMPKVAVVLEVTEAPAAPQLRKALERLAEHAGVPSMNWWDRVDSAMRQTFLDEESGRELGDCLWNAGVWRVEELFAPAMPIQLLTAPSSHFNTKLAPPLNPLDWRAAEHDVLLVLQNCFGLLFPTGWRISSTWLSKKTGHHSTAVCRALKNFQDKGLLVCLNKHWVRGEYSRAWAAKGELANAIEYVREATPANRKQLPKKLSDGYSFSQLRDATWHFSDIDGYLAWVKTVQPVNRKQRWEKAESIARAHFSRNRVRHV